jgi:hypothetical protein
MIVCFKEIDSAPTQLALHIVSQKRLSIRWDFPAQPAQCSLYFILSGTLDGASIQQIVGGQAREHELDVVDPNSANLQISAANKLGTGPASSTMNVQQVSKTGWLKNEPYCSIQVEKFPSKKTIILCIH